MTVQQLVVEITTKKEREKEKETRFFLLMHKKLHLSIHMEKKHVPIVFCLLTVDCEKENDKKGKGVDSVGARARCSA